MNNPNDKHSSLYDSFAAKSLSLFAASSDKTREAMHAAIDKAHDQMTALGELSAEQGKQFQRYLHRDLKQTARYIRDLGEEAKDQLKPSRLGAGALATMAALLHMGSDALLQLSIKAEEALTYKAGEVTSAGTLTCTQCAMTREFSNTSLIQRCPSCHNDTFIKSH
ncbi:MAG: hypothetical protein V4603_12595 [Pseudomonadota bacterium]